MVTSLLCLKGSVPDSKFRVTFHHFGLFNREPLIVEPRKVGYMKGKGDNNLGTFPSVYDER